jgi:hypothetical protein
MHLIPNHHASLASAKRFSPPPLPSGLHPTDPSPATGETHADPFQPSWNGPGRGATSLRFAAWMMLAGWLFFLVVGLFHVDRPDANNHAAAFADYARSSIWTPVHLGQFAGMAALLTGMVMLSLSLPSRVGAGRWLNRISALAAAAGLALYGVLQAVDGVALKQAVDSWAAADEPDRASRFAAAEAVRWLEWGLRSYASVVIGLALLLLGIAVVSGGRLPRVVGLLISLSGTAYLAQGWIIGSNGFTVSNRAPTWLALLLMTIWTLWLVPATRER